MPQKHDIGWKKRNRPTPPAREVIDTELLASRLVSEGLADWYILEARRHANYPKQAGTP